ncbi:MAG: glutamate synthase-related protein, partial [Candidatus Nezhaarchaeales archaeon]
TTGTRARVEDLCPSSGMCPLCIADCPFLCEVSLAAFRGREALYPDPLYFGRSTAASLKDYWIDWSHFNILSSLTGFKGIEEDPDVALFTNVNVETAVAGVPLKVPVVLGAYGSTEVARRYWDGLAVGAALSGVMIVVGENVCGVDPEARIEKGKVTRSAELERRVSSFRKFWDGKYGSVAVQTNVEDQRLGVDVYAISKLEVDTIERKWGQGAKAIGGEIRVDSLERAIELKRRGYIVIPDPEDRDVQEAFKQGAFRTFERHSRVGAPREREFVEDVEWLREQGARRVGIKMGSYRPEAVAFTMKVASEAKVDYVVFDGAEGGTGMSPVPMMNEMGTPTVYLEAQVLKCAEILRRKGRHVPDVLMAGGFVDETQIFKAIAMSNFGEGPYVKAVLMARAPLTAAMKATLFARLAEEGRLPKPFEERYGGSPERFFIAAPELRARLGERFREVPWGAVGLYSYLDKVKVGLQQLLAGARKWRLSLIDRSDLVALTEGASRATGIPTFEEMGKVIEYMLS